jgi:hypothetical protein
MLKKIISGAVALFLGLLAVGFVGAPANASESRKEAICHATNGKNFYEHELVPRQSIIQGGHGENGVNVGDIIPPFEYNFDGGPVEQYPGQNWTPENVTLWKKFCNPDTNVLTPVLPVSPVATCTNPNPTLTIPAQPNGLNVSSTADDKGNFTVSYELPKNTAYNTYAFPEGFKNNVSISATDNRQSDPLWDPATGTCKMPDTGAGQIKSEHILWAGMLIFAGLVLTTVVRRKKS